MKQHRNKPAQGKLCVMCGHPLRRVYYAIGDLGRVCTSCVAEAAATAIGAKRRQHRPKKVAT